MAQRTALRHPAVFQFGDQDRPDPVNLLAAARRPLADEGRDVGRRILQGRQQGLQQGGGVARADPAEVAQPVVLGHADQQGTEARPAFGRPTADHHLVAAPAFGLDPGRGSTRPIGGVQLLGDHAFQVHAAGAVQHRLPGRGEVIDIAQPFARLGRNPVDVSLKPRLAVRQGQVPQIVLTLAQQVEGEIDQAGGLAVRYGRLKGGEVGGVILAQGAQFTVNHPVGPGRRIRRQFRKTVGPVVAATGVEPRLPAPGRHLDAVAVELDLMHPAGAARRMVGDLAQLDRDEGRRFRQRRLARPGLGFGRSLAHDGTRGGPFLLPLGYLRQAAARDDGGVDLHIGVALARHGRLVLLLDQQPVVAFGRLAAIRLQPHQGPAAPQTFAVQGHLQRAALQRRLDIRLLRLPLAPVPQLDRARAIVAGRNGPLEASIVERMILDLDRQALDGRIARRGLCHGPRLQHSVMLDAEVVVQPCRGVPLDQIGQPALARRLGGARGFRRAGEVPLGLIGIQSVRHAALVRHPISDAARSARLCWTGRPRPAGCAAGRRRSRRPGDRAPRRP
jgi:hypothetical protein